MLPNFSDPKSIVEALDENIVGQHEAKKALALAVSNREVNFYHKYNETRIYEGLKDLDKPTVLLIGKSGTGKTMLVEELAKILDVPVLILDGSAVAPHGWHGYSTNDWLNELKAKINTMLHRNDPIKGEDKWGAAIINTDKVKPLSFKTMDEGFSKAIVFIDEFDKLAAKFSDPTHDAYYKARQQNFLRLIEGTEVVVTPTAPSLTNSPIPISTRGTLFILGGAFSGLEDSIKEVQDLTDIGFFASPKIKSYDSINVTRKHLSKYGIIPELANRITSIVKMQSMTVKDYRNIITEGHRSILFHYQVYFGTHGVELKIDDHMLDRIAKLAFERDEGARSLKELFYDLLKDYMYDIKSYTGRTVTISQFPGEEVQAEVPRAMEMVL